MRIASYNIRKGIGLDRRREPSRIIEVLKEINADIVILQEADKRVGKRVSALPDELIQQFTDYQVANLSIRPDSIGWHGNAILVRKDMKVAATNRIELPILEPRGAVAAELITKENIRLRIVGAHLALLPQVQSRQVCHLLEMVYNMGHDVPVVVGGDFNEWKRKNEAYDIKGTHFYIKEVGYSYHSTRPFIGLDRFIVSQEIDIVDGGVHTSALSRRASDHLPIWVDIDINRLIERQARRVAS